MRELEPNLVGAWCEEYQDLLQQGGELALTNEDVMAQLNVDKDGSGEKQTQ